ncbi:hypothetical protein D3C78_1647930 [compost metagenome]
MREQIETLENHGNLSADLVDAFRVTINTFGGHQDVPALVCLQAIDAPKKRGFTRA